MRTNWTKAEKLTMLLFTHKTSKILQTLYKSIKRRLKPWTNHQKTSM